MPSVSLSGFHTFLFIGPTPHRPLLSVSPLHTERVHSSFRVFSGGMSCSGLHFSLPSTLVKPSPTLHPLPSTSPARKGRKPPATTTTVTLVTSCRSVTLLYNVNPVRLTLLGDSDGSSHWVPYLPILTSRPGEEGPVGVR